MKKQTAVILVLIAFIGGAVSGFIGGKYTGSRELTRIWSHVVEEDLVASSLLDVTVQYHALKLLKDGQTEKAAAHLQTFLHSSLQIVDTLSTTLHRPDMLTNSAVVNARSFDKN